MNSADESAKATWQSTPDAVQGRQAATPREASSLTAIRLYGLAVVLVATALGLALVADVQAIEHLGFPLFLMAVSVAVWYAGPGVSRSFDAAIAAR